MVFRILQSKVRIRAAPPGGAREIPRARPQGMTADRTIAMHSSPFAIERRDLPSQQEEGRGPHDDAPSPWPHGDRRSTISRSSRSFSPCPRSQDTEQAPEQHGERESRNQNAPSNQLQHPISMRLDPNEGTIPRHPETSSDRLLRGNCLEPPGVALIPCGDDGTRRRRMAACVRPARPPETPSRDRRSDP